jgi:hypothetical protein
MPRSAIAFVALFCIMACKDPFVDDCACTVKACFEGISVRLAGNPDTARFAGFSATIAYGDTTEAPSWPWGSAVEEEFLFSSGKLRRLKPESIGIRISYLEDGVEKSLAVDSDVAWTAQVCNACSGSAPSCKDQMAHVGKATIDLESLL